MFVIWKVVIFCYQWLSMKCMWQQEICGMLELKLMCIFLSMEKKVTQDQDSCSGHRNPRNLWKDKWVQELFPLFFFFSGFLPLQWAVMLQLWEIITAFLRYFKIPQLNQNYFLMVNQCFWKMSRIFIYKIGKLCTSVFNT